MGMALLISSLIFACFIYFSIFTNPRSRIFTEKCQYINNLFDIVGVASLTSGKPSIRLHCHPWGYVTHARTHEASHAFRYEVRASFLFGNQPPGKNQFRLGAPKSNQTTEESGIFCFWFGAFLLGKKIKMESNKNSKTSSWQCCAMLHKCLRMAFPPHDPDKTWMVFDHDLWTNQSGT